MNAIFKIANTEYFSVWSIITLKDAALDVLTQSNLEAKAKLTESFVMYWENGVINQITDDNTNERPIPDHPSRPILEKNDSVLKRSSAAATIHAIAHAESYAIDLFWDCIARFVHERLPIEYYNNMVHIAGI